MAIAMSVLLSPTHPEAQAAFFRTYGGTSLDFGYSVQQTRDGGYIMAGMTSSFGAGLSDFYVVKTDSLGDTVWTRTHGGSSTDAAHSVQQTADGGYIICGEERSFGTTPCSFYLVKVNPSGDTLWTRSYGGPDAEEGRCVRQTADGGYVLAGLTHSWGAGDWDGYVVRIDSIGDTLWTSVFGDLGSDALNSVRQTEDGGYVAAGKILNLSAGSVDAYVVRMDASGNALWTHTYGGADLEEAFEVEQTWDHGFIIVGTTRPLSSDYGDIYLIKTDSLGDTLWSRTYGEAGDEEGYSVQPTMDGGYIVAGTSSSFGLGDYDIYLIRTDCAGDTVVIFHVAFPGDESGRCVRRTSDGGFIVTGTTNSIGAGFEDAFLLKIQGEAIHNVGVASLDAPSDTVYVDSTYSVKATVRNYGNCPEVFDVVCTIDGYADTLHVGNLDPGSLYQISFRDWQVPPSVPATYYLGVCTEDPDDVDSTNDCRSKAVYAYDPTGAEERPRTPPGTYFGLSQNKPNPFHRSTVIEYSLPTQCEVTLSVYDATGRLMGTLAEERQGPGVFGTRWNPQGCADGIYFCRLTACPERSPELGEGRSRRAGDFVDTRKIVLVR